MNKFIDEKARLSAIEAIKKWNEMREAQRNQRFCLRKDDDGHMYLVPTNLTLKFMEYVDAAACGDPIDLPVGCKMVELWNLSFTNPSEDV